MNLTEMLINEVQKYPIIYDHKLKEYRDVVKKNKAWANIAHVLHSEIDTCKVKWKSIRDRYLKEKKMVKMDPSVTGAKHKKPWSIMPRLDFLKDVMMTTNCLTSSNFEYDSSFISLRSSIDEPTLFRSSVEDIGLPDEHVPSPQTILNIEDSISSEPSSGVSHTLKSKGKKRKATDINLQILKEIQGKPSYDEEELFCLSLVGPLKRLRPRDRIKVKSQFYKILADQEYVE